MNSRVHSKERERGPFGGGVYMAKKMITVCGSSWKVGQEPEGDGRKEEVKWHLSVNVFPEPEL